MDKWVIAVGPAPKSSTAGKTRGRRILKGDALREWLYEQCRKDEGIGGSARLESIADILSAHGIAIEDVLDDLTEEEAEEEAGDEANGVADDEGAQADVGSQG